MKCINEWLIATAKGLPFALFTLAITLGLVYYLIRGLPGPALGM